MHTGTEPRLDSKVAILRELPGVSTSVETAENLVPNNSHVKLLRAFRDQAWALGFESRVES